MGCEGIFVNNEIVRNFYGDCLFKIDPSKMNRQNK